MAVLPTGSMGHWQVEQVAAGVGFVSLAFHWPESGLAATFGLQVPPRVLVLLDLPEAQYALKKEFT